jgi:Leucine-rich repeat (LRR) protein
LDFSDNPLEEIDKRVLSNLSKLSEVSLTYPKHPVA